MKLRDIDAKSFEYEIRFCCNMCGFPILNQEKVETLYQFCREYNGHLEIEDVRGGFGALAAGFLEDKHENVKSMSSLTLNRVVTSYLRAKRAKQDSVKQPDADRSYLTDENKKLIEDNFNHMATYNDELNDDEKKYLMYHWIGENRKNYLASGQLMCVTSISYDFLLKEGEIRITDKMFQGLIKGSYVDLMPWAEIERNAMDLKKREDIVLAKSKQGNYRAMIEKQAGINHKDAAKRYAVALYFTNN